MYQQCAARRWMERGGPCSKWRSLPQIVLPVTLRITSLSSTIFGFGHSTDGDWDQLRLTVRRGGLRILTHLDAVLALPGQSLHGLGGIAILLAVAGGIGDILLRDGVITMADGLLSLGCNLRQHGGRWFNRCGLG